VNRIQRCITVLAVLAGTLLTLTAVASAAPAVPPPAKFPPPVVARIHTVVTGGMPGWQITLIAVGAALAAAALAVLLDRAWAARSRAIATTA
jgi:hypothetical protein